MRIMNKCVLRAAAAFAFAAVVPSLTMAQNDGGLRNPLERANRTAQAGDDARRMESLELKTLSRDPARAPERKRDLYLVFAQVREDYKQIQVVNNDLARSLHSGALEFKDAAKAVSEIRMLAARLKKNLTLSKPEKSSPRPRPEAGEGAGQLKSLLLSLDKLVLEFVNNPIFKSPETADARMSAKARVDLEQIITVSDRIKKSGEKLK